MNKFYKSISLLLCLVCVFPLFSGCNKKDSDKEHTEIKQDFIGTHQFLKTEKDSFVVKDGKSDYKIVIPTNFTMKEKTASSELQLFFEEATNVFLPVIEDDELSFSKEDKYFSIGDTCLKAQANLNFDTSILKTSGVRVQTKDNTIFLYGDTEVGTLNAVYAFLQDAFHYDFFYDGFYYIDKGITDLKLYDYDIIDIPDFDNRRATTAVNENTTFLNRYKEGFKPGECPRVKGKLQGYVGSLLSLWLPKAEYLFNEENPEQNHPKWYSEDNNGNLTTQICYSAKGDENEYKALVDTMVGMIEDAFRKDTQRSKIMIGNADDGICCKCKACQESIDKYGSITGSLIHFCNDIKASVDEWMKTDDGKPFARDWTIEFLAYMAYDTAPVKLDENGKKYATIKCAENVLPLYAPLNMDWTKAMTHEDNADWQEKTLDWKLCSPTVPVWFYATDFHYYLSPFNTYDSMHETLKFMEKHDITEDVYLQGQSNQTPRSTGWDMFKMYYYSKILWNLNYSIEDLADAWCKNVYGEYAAPIMRELFDQTRLQLEYMKDEGFSGLRIIYKDPLDSKYFPISVLNNWLDGYNKALDLALRNGESELTQKMIRAERVSCLYLLSQIYASSLPNSQLYNYRKMLLYDAKFSAVKLYRETSDKIYYVDDLANIWGM